MCDASCCARQARIGRRHREPCIRSRRSTGRSLGTPRCLQARPLGSFFFTFSLNLLGASDGGSLV